ncbi:unnamed protein product [Ceratitis capitata]|uniref:(Mediterranean fruit fly) hypothetical protein n=1 Tax=Ceratitis capitata TaxID=7213 RepID=A0A811V0H7_CERCA|nr:unnamed protein product [Ceratitis capitata]
MSVGYVIAVAVVRGIATKQALGNTLVELCCCVVALLCYASRSVDDMASDTDTTLLCYAVYAVGKVPMKSAESSFQVE